MTSTAITLNMQDPVVTRGQVACEKIKDAAVSAISAYGNNIRVALNDELRFVGIDLCTMLSIDKNCLDLINNERRKEVSLKSGTVEVLDWISAIRLIDHADLSCTDTLKSAIWFVTFAVPYLHDEKMMFGETKMYIGGSKGMEDMCAVMEKLMWYTQHSALAVNLGHLKN